MAKRDFSQLTSEERLAIFQAAQEERQRIIQEAIDNGAKVTYMTSRISGEEQETHISIDTDGTCIIDTTIQKDITKCIKRGWQIIGITYYRDSEIIAGLICKGKSNNITIGTIK